MSIPLRELEQHFRELQYYLRNGLASRVKLELINRFISNVGVQDNPYRYLSYFQEIYEDFLGLLEPENLQFRSTDFLTDLDNQVQLMKQAGLNEVSDPDYRAYHENLRYQQIAACCYTGDQHGLELLTGIKIQYESGVDPYDVLSRILSAGEFKDQKNIEILEKICQNWQNDALGWSRDTVWIPLVEQETTQHFGKVEIATLQRLRVDVEARRHGADMDLIFFDNHPLSVGDPVYDQALDAVGAAKMHLKIHRQGKIPKFRIMFGFPGKQYFYTGESFGLGMSLTVLAQMEKVLIQRNQHQLAKNVVITGGIDMLGQVRGVSEQSLPAKLAAFYYSPFQIFVYPEINTGVVENSLEELVKGRKLKVKSQRSKVESHVVSNQDIGNQSYLTIPTSQLPNLPTFKLNNLPTSQLPNLLTSQRVVQKQSISIKAWSQAHIRKNQVMRYVAAILLIAGIGWGSWWFSRDLNPVRAQVIDHVLRVFNSQDDLLWEYPFNFYLTTGRYNKTANMRKSLKRMSIDDFDNDGKNELILGVSEITEGENGTTYYFESDGTLIWKYQPDSKVSFGGADIGGSFSTKFILPIMSLVESETKFVINLSHSLYYPTRLILLDIHGNVINTFWNSGTISDAFIVSRDSRTVQNLIFSGTNNEYGQGIIGILPIDKLWGRSPQTNDHYIPDGVKFDASIKYLKFPHFNKYLNPDEIARDEVRLIWLESDSLIKVQMLQSGVQYSFSRDYKLLNYMITDSYFTSYFGKHKTHLFQAHSFSKVDSVIRAIDEWKGFSWIRLTSSP